MTEPRARCYLQPLVELLRDGRLDARERASMERHLEDCAECQASHHDLARLAQLLRDAEPAEPASIPTAPQAAPNPGPAGPALISGEPQGAATALDHRRGRMRLLQAAAHLESSPERTTFAGLSAAAIPSRVGWAMPAGAIVVAMLAVLGAARFRVPSVTHAPAAAATTIAPPPSGEAPPTMEVPASPSPPLDEAPADPASHASTPVSTMEPRSAAPVLVSHRTPPLAQPVHGGPDAPSAPAVAAPSSSETFASGVGSMEQGNFGEAIDRLGAFRKSHPEDSRSEDAAFLMIVALQRAGRHGDAVAAAREYLSLYPSGYRCKEAQSIVARGE